ncbi:ribonuclease P protein component [Parapedobacter sp. 10938]|uniref:ribonuclease P protein component n=1 Tax=Parapedobacter flavus TaxID=3110225 RepID=UPI002DBAD5A3|nr:ribonuclease P protein component [Parapedobacter sp. 10938]MEC3880591.1 ribonuclease P protein component [Parapedobacter sp. 10938]
MERKTFSKEERLCSKRLIDSLFHSGSSFLVYPYRVVFMRVEGAAMVQVLLSVSKRRFRHAVQRNLLKRRMRESYRLQKGERLYPTMEGKPYGLAIAIQYVGKELLDFSFMRDRMADVLEKLHNEA